MRITSPCPHPVTRNIFSAPMKQYVNRLKIAHKLLISSLAFALPIAVLLYFVISGFTYNIYMARMEVRGNQLLAPLERLVSLIPRHQRLTHAYLAGNKAVLNEITLIATRIDESFSRLLGEAGKTDAAFQIDEHSLKQAGMEQLLPERTQQRWRAVRSMWRSTTAEHNDFAHLDLSISITSLIKRIGDVSHMILDPDLDSWYIIDMVLLTLPKAQERLSEILRFGQPVLSRGLIIQDDAVQFSIHTAMLEEIDLLRVRDSSAAALRENNNFYGVSPSLQKNMPLLLAHYESSLRSLLDQLYSLSPGTPQNGSAEEFLKRGEAAIDAGAKLWQGAMAELHILLQKRIASYERKLFIALLLSLAALAAAVGLVLFIAGGITRPLSRVTAIAGEIAAGNLQTARQRLGACDMFSGCTDAAQAARVNTFRDETWQLFQAFSTMVCKLDSLLSQVHSSSLQVNTSAARIAVSVRQLDATVAEQESATRQVKETSTEISATTTELARTMDTVTTMAQEATDLAVSGMESLSEINTAMQELTDTTSEISDKLRIVSEKTGTITQVITTIVTVANQTNLLSLNAAIEAEKAGEYGRGFSVVAREMRRLADQTAVATLDIEGIITAMQAAVTDGVAGMERYTRQAHASSEKIVRTNGNLRTVIEHIGDVGPQCEMVNRRMQILSHSGGQISEAMKQLNETARQTRAALTEFKTVIEQLNAAVRGLQEEMAQFSVTAQD